MKFLRYALPAVLACVAGAASASAQQQPPPPPPRLPVFLDCERFCDFDFIRRTVDFVDWVRNRDDALVHLLVTRQQTAAGGSEYTLFFIGRDRFATRQDTLRLAVRQDETDDERRTALTRVLALGLGPFVAQTRIARNVEMLLGEVDVEDRAQLTTHDPWNAWVFRIRAGGSIEGEESERQLSFDGSLSADRITEDLKIELGAFGRYQQDEFEFEDDDTGELETLVSITRNINSDALVVWSLGPHWSSGFEARIGSSTRLNQDIYYSGAAALEYSFYPYAESSRRQITALYTIGPVHYAYDEETVFEKTAETLVEQNIEIAAAFEQPWGEIDAGVEWSNFMNDFSLHRLDIEAGIEVRLFRGLSLDVNGGVARIENQIYLSAEGASREEILLRRTQLGTGFQYDFRVGLSYTFGSVLNNVVNPRMRRGGGDFFR